MSLNIKTLEEMGAFTGAPVERFIKWKKGKEEFEATVYVLPLSYRSAVSDVSSHSKNFDPVAGRIAASICDENGKPVFTVGDITGEADPKRGPIDGNLTLALLNVIGEVNGLGKKQA